MFNDFILYFIELYFDVAEIQQEHKFQWNKTVVHLRNRLFPIIEEFEKFADVCSPNIYMEFISRSQVYDHEEREWNNIFNDSLTIPFGGFNPRAQLDKILNQLEALLMYVKEFPYVRPTL